MKEITQRTYRERILAILVYIQENLNRDLALEDLARVSHFSVYHFHRIFSAHVGETVYKCVRRLRLERAAVSLRQSDRAVTQVAFDAGFETLEAFSRAFRGMFDMTPSEFRIRDGSLVKPEALGINVDSDLSGRAAATVRTLPDRTIAFVRHTGPYQEVGGAFERLMEWAAPRGLLGGNPDILGICYDHPEVTPSDKIRFDAAMTVDDSVVPDGDIGVRRLPGGEHVVVCHQGPYNEVGPTYDFIYGHWLPANHREPSDAPPFEVYLNDPEGTEPEELLTDVHVPLRPPGKQR